MTVFVNTHAKHTRGFSLIEILVGLGVMAVAMTVMSGYISSISSQQRILMLKSESIAIATNLTNVFMPTSQHCSGNIYTAAITFAGTPPAAPQNIACSTCAAGHQAINYYNSKGKVLAPDITMGVQDDGSGLNVSSVQLEKISPAGPDQYKADIVVNFGNTNPVLPSIKVARQLLLSATTSGGNTTLVSCGTTSCAAGYTSVGGPNGADAFCIQTRTNPETHFSQAQANCVRTGGQHYHLCTEQEWMEACLVYSPNGVNDGGAPLNMGEMPTADGNTSEWVALLNEYDDGSGNRSESATIMGGNDAKVGADKGSTGQHTCFGFAQRWQYEWDPSPTMYVHSYRCCYRP